jgi:hypothetical protein
MSVVCCAGRGLCVGLITRPEESYRVRCVCDREALIMRSRWPTRGSCAMRGGGGEELIIKKCELNMLTELDT